MSETPTTSTASEPDAFPCRKWRGEWVVADGRRFSTDCGYCGWPKPDHIGGEADRG